MKDSFRRGANIVLHSSYIFMPRTSSMLRDMRIREFELSTGQQQSTTIEVLDIWKHHILVDCCRYKIINKNNNNCKALVIKTHPSLTRNSLLPTLCSVFVQTQTRMRSTDKTRNATYAGSSTTFCVSGLTFSATICGPKPQNVILLGGQSTANALTFLEIFLEQDKSVV